MTDSTNPSQVLLRIDDVGRFSSPKDSLIEALCSAKLKVSCAVVPEWLDDECERHLLNLASRYPGTLEVQQHGFAHHNYSSDNLEYEFGPSRSYHQQLEDIAAGKGKLERTFGSLFTPCFTPPFASHDLNTLIALRECGFRFICGQDSRTFDSSVGIIDIPANVDGFTWHPTRERAWTEVQKELELNAGTLGSLVLHPHQMADERINQYVAGMITYFTPDMTIHASDSTKHPPTKR